MIAENLLLKQQLIIHSRSRQRAPNLTTQDRTLLGFLSLFMHPKRIARSSIIIRPSTLLSFHNAMKKRKYRLPYSPKGGKGPLPWNQEPIRSSTSATTGGRSIVGDCFSCQWQLDIGIRQRQAVYLSYTRREDFYVRVMRPQIMRSRASLLHCTVFLFPAHLLQVVTETVVPDILMAADTHAICLTTEIALMGTSGHAIVLCAFLQILVASQA